MMCAVCLEALDVMGSKCIQTKCGHSFHWDCMTKWFTIRNECALCRSILQVYDCTSIEVSSITCPNGIIVNELLFYPQSIQEFSFVLLYLFLLQHDILISKVSHHVNTSLANIIRDIVTRSSHHRLVEWKNTYPNFYHDKSLNMHVMLTKGVDIEKDSFPSIHIDDIRFLFTQHTTSNLLLI
jgi:hypothetical protein